MVKIKKAVIEVMLVSLEARRNAIKGYILNRDMQFEVKMLTAQIDALEKELKDFAVSLVQ